MIITHIENGMPVTYYINHIDSLNKIGYPSVRCGNKIGLNTLDYKKARKATGNLKKILAIIAKCKPVKDSFLRQIKEKDFITMILQNKN